MYNIHIDVGVSRAIMIENIFVHYLKLFNQNVKFSTFFKEKLTLIDMKIIFAIYILQKYLKSGKIFEI